MPDDILYKAKLHWILFFSPCLLAATNLIIALRFPEPILKPLILLTFSIAFIWGCLVAITYAFSSVTIKQKHVILESGLWIRQTVDIPLDHIESIDIRQTILGSLLNYGSITITGTGGSRQVIHHLNHPLTCRRHIEQAMHHHC